MYFVKTIVCRNHIYRTSKFKLLHSYIGAQIQKTEETDIIFSGIGGVSYQFFSNMVWTKPKKITLHKSKAWSNSHTLKERKKAEEENKQDTSKCRTETAKESEQNRLLYDRLLVQEMRNQKGKS